jgi:hypothetical protein
LYNILSKDEKRARVDETEIVKKQRRARMGKLSKRARTCDRKSLKHFCLKKILSPQNYICSVKRRDLSTMQIK